MASATASSEARELALIGKVEMRFALAETDAKLQDILATYLAPLLLKLASDSVQVRNKVISICQHINTRVKPGSIQLPVASLLKQFKEHPSTPLVRHFDMLYIQLGLGRLPPPKRIELLPDLIGGISANALGNPLHGSQLFHAVLQLLHLYPFPERGTNDDRDLRTALKLSDTDARFLANWFGKLLLLTPRRNQQAQSSSGNPGLTEEEYQFLMVHGKVDVWNPTAEGGLNLSETKAVLVKALASGLLTPKERLMPTLFASADSNPEVSMLGEDILKRTIPNVDLEDPSIVDYLFQLYLGGQASPAPVPVRIKILGLLTKSSSSASHTANILRMMEEGLTGDGGQASGRLLHRYRTAIFAFLQSVARHGKPETLQQVSPVLVRQLRAFIEDAGWPIQTEGDASLRGTAYELIGVFARATPTLVTADPNLSLLRFLFKSLEQDTSSIDTGASIQEALLNLMGAFHGRLSSDETMSRFKQLLLDAMEPSPARQSLPRTRNVQFVTTRYANSCLPYNDVSARWIDILAIHQPSRDVVEEGKKGLDPAWHLSDGDYTIPSLEKGKRALFPHFSALIRGIFLNGKNSTLNSDLEDTLPEGTECLKRLYNFEQHFSFCVPTAVAYTMSVLFANALQAAGIVVDTSLDWERKLGVLVQNDEKARRAVREYLRAAVQSSPENVTARAAIILLHAALDLLVAPNRSTIPAALGAFTDLCTLCPESLVSQINLTSYLGQLDEAVLSNDSTRRQEGAHAFGLLASRKDCPKDETMNRISSYLGFMKAWPEAVGESLNKAMGSALALAFFWGRATWRETSSGFEPQQEDFLLTLFNILRQSKDLALLDTVYASISQLCMFATLNPTLVAAHLPFNELVDNIYENARKGSSPATFALGHLGLICDEVVVQDDGDSSLRYLESKIYSLHDIRDMEAQFTIGESLCILVCGWSCQPLAVQLDVDKHIQPDQPKYPALPAREGTLTGALKKLIVDCQSMKPSLKKASVIWLLSFVQYCGDQEPLRKQLRQCQLAFMTCLSSNDQVVQEAASRGLSLVYDKGGQDARDELIRDLVNLFSDNKPALSGNVTEDTQLFEVGALPTGGGSSVTTYKDILNLATEVGDSSLVYRFMSLASNSSIWTTRAAFGRFGLSNIFSDSSTEGYLAKNPKLYPKLYRYRFDPNPNVQRSMNDIWDALVKDSSATLREHFNAIIEDLLRNILTKEWRVRQACCAGIADLLQGRPIEVYEQYLPQIWSLCFKVLDDIKESVRTAAASLARVLTNILIRNLDNSKGPSKQANAMLEDVIPFLLSTLESSAEEVQALSQSTLLQIIEKSERSYIRPFVSTLIAEFVGRLSSLEPQALNYIRMKASHYNLTAEKVDDLRLQGIRGSPMMEAVERCLDALDEEIMDEAMSKLHETIKRSIGFPSKVAGSRVLVSLSTRHQGLFRPYADRFLVLAFTQMKDPNQHVAVSFATAAGYVSRLASDAAILQLVASSRKLYFDSEDETPRLVSADVIAALVTYAPDRSSSLHLDILPFVFFAKQDSSEQVREIYKRTWNNSVGGSLTVSLYLKEIVSLAQSHIDAARWNIKHTACRAISDAVLTLAASDISTANAAVLWPALENALGGKTWDGKEVTLNALVKFVEKAAAYWRGNAHVAAQINKIAIREAKRRNEKYQQFALAALGNIAAARSDVDMSDDVFSIIDPILEELVPDDASDAMDINDDNGESTSKSRTKSLIVIVQCSLKSMSPGVTSADQLPRALDKMARASRTRTRDIHLAIFEVIHVQFEAFCTIEGAFSALDVEAVKKKLTNLLFKSSYADFPEAMRLERAKAIVAVHTFRNVLIAEAYVQKELTEEKSDMVRGELKKALAPKI